MPAGRATSAAARASVRRRRAIHGASSSHRLARGPLGRAPGERHGHAPVRVDGDADAARALGAADAVLGDGHGGASNGSRVGGGCGRAARRVRSRCGAERRPRRCAPVRRERRPRANVNGGIEGSAGGRWRPSRGARFRDISRRHRRARDENLPHSERFSPSAARIAANVENLPPPAARGGPPPPSPPALPSMPPLTCVEGRRSLPTEAPGRRAPTAPATSPATCPARRSRRPGRAPRAGSGPRPR